MMTAKTYTCQLCGGTFECPEDEAKKEEEFAHNFPGETLDKRLSVCTECYETKVKPILDAQPFGVMPKRE